MEVLAGPAASRRVVHLLAARAHTALPPAASYELTDFQREAVQRAARIIDERGGVLIADSVGLGKTYVALGLIDHAVARGARQVLVTSPASIRPQWTRELRRLSRSRELDWHSTATRTVTASDRWIAFASHAVLGRCALTPQFIVVDEAHAFRNPRTLRYRALSLLCARAQVVLLTATPVNNRLLDLYFQLRLFLADSALTDVGVPDLAALFRADQPERVASDIDRALAPVVIRRTRQQLLERHGPQAGQRFPERAPPVPVHYHSAWQGAVLEGMQRLALSTFGIAKDNEAARTATPELIRYVLLKRMESSPHALLTSLKQLHMYLVAFCDSARTGLLLTPAAHRVGSGNTGQLALDALLLAPFPRARSVADEIRRAECDIGLTRNLLVILEQVVRKRDAKAARLLELLRTELRDSKAIVFTEFRSTARALFQVCANMRVGLIDGSGAWLASGRASRAAVVHKFAPHANHAPVPPAREQVDLLIATDVLAEGLNLQDADVVISYDLPWNPVRLIQRLGRIDRMGSPHTQVRPFNFMPDHELDEMLGLMRRIDAKLAAIRSSVGDETDPLGDAAEARSQYGHRMERATCEPIVHQKFASLVRRIASRDPDLFADLEPPVPNAASLEDRWYAVLEQSRQYNSPRAPRDTARAPSGSADQTVRGVAYSRHARAPCWLIVVTDGPGVRFVAADDSGASEPDREFGLTVLLEQLNGAAVTPGVQDDAEHEWIRFDEGDWLMARALERAIAGDPVGSAGATAASASLARRLVRLVGRLPGGPDAVLCSRVDRILAAIRAGLRAGPALEIDLALVELERERTGSTTRPKDSVQILKPDADRRSGGSARTGMNPVALVASALDRIEAALGLANADNSQDRPRVPQAPTPAVIAILKVQRATC